MKRIHLFEWEDFPWFPENIRNLVTDYLQFIVNLTRPYRVVVPRLAKLINRNGLSLIIDYGSGASGPILEIAKQLAADFGLRPRFILTDKYPHQQVIEQISQKARQWDLHVEYSLKPVDVISSIPELNGLHTFFNAFHHLPPRQAAHLLQSFARKKQPVAIFELTGRHLWTMFIIFISPLYVWLLTPFIKPFRWKRLLFTYLLPVVPFVVWWDGMVSNFRTYSSEEIKKFIEKQENKDFQWEIGEMKSVLNIRVKYVIGYPSDPGFPPGLR